MKIVFMGTPDFACESLKCLTENNKNIIAVVTNPDKPKGRGMKVIESPVKEYAKSKKIKIYQPLKVRGNSDFIEEIKSLKPDLLCVVAYGKILPMEILEIPRYGAINVHGSLLPKYRGAAPIQWAVLNGEEETGNTTMFMDEGMDTGDIIFQSKVKIGEDETTGELWNELALDGGKLLLKTVNEIEKITESSEIKEIEDEYKNVIEKSNVNKKDIDDLKLDVKKISTNETNLDTNSNEKINLVDELVKERNVKLQNEIKKQIGARKQGRDFTVAPMLDKKMAYINWNETSNKINNLIRGLNPIMGAYTFYNGKKIKIWKSKIIDENNFKEITGNDLKKYTDENVGTILYVDKNCLIVKTKDSAIAIQEIQAENSKKMSIRDFLNGNKINQFENFK